MTRRACVAHDALPYDEEVALALQLASTRDAAHALHHCIGALALEPTREEWRPLLRLLFTEAKLIESLHGENFYGAQAARAFHLHESGALIEAITLAVEVYRSAPHAGFHHWVTAWCEEANAAKIDCDPTLLVRALLVGTSFGGGRLSLLPAEREAAEELVPLARIATSLSAGDKRVSLLASAILRRAGRNAEALKVAETTHGADGDDPAYLMTKALALRASRRWGGALEAFDTAFAISNDPRYLIESFRVLADAGRWSDALEQWARFLSIAQPDDENLLEYAAVENAYNEHAPAPSEPFLSIVRRRALGHGTLWPMRDATADALREVGADARTRSKSRASAGDVIRKGRIVMNVSGNEGPSNRLCLALMLTGNPDPRQATYSIAGESLRLLSGHTYATSDYAPWKEEDGVIVQALPVPPSNVSAWIERLALLETTPVVTAGDLAPSSDFLDLWLAARRDVPPRASAREWVAAMVYPTMPIDCAWMGPDWVYRWQVVAAIGLAHAEPGWAGTEKRSALLALLNGAIDWPLAAAIRVAAELALWEPTATKELRDALRTLTYSLGGEPNEALVAALHGALEMIPYVPREDIERAYRQLHASDAPGSNERETLEAAPEVAPKAPPSRPKRPWWKLWGGAS